MMKKKNIIISMIIIILFLISNFCGCIENQNYDYLNHIVIINEEYQHRDDWLKYKEVFGIVENSGNLSWDKITIKVSFFNKNNYLLKEKYDFINHLQPFENKSFRVVYENYEKFYDEISYYKVEIYEQVLKKPE